jgi:cytidylate kinase
MLDAGHNIPFEQVLKDLEHRDKLDTERTNSPLKAAAYAKILKTDNIELTDVVDHIIALMDNEV